MKRLPFVIVMVIAVIVAVVTGCGRTPRYDGRLTAADSLMRTNPDSALALLEAIPMAGLATAGDSAYRDLLLTQARYRCYVTATSDSAINRALAYYRAHGGEREKLTRAYIYKGAVMDELCYPDSAMLYYKHAEATAAPDDYFNLGYCNLRIAELYQDQIVNSNEVIKRMQKARNAFSSINDTFYLVITTGTLGAYFQSTDKDSSRLLLQHAIEMAQAINSPDRFFYQSKLAGLFYYEKNYLQAKDIAMRIIKEGKDSCAENQFLYYAANSFIHLGKIDSAKWVKTLIPEPKTLQDSMNYYSLNAEFAKSSMQWIDYYAFREKTEILHRKLISKSADSNLVEAGMKMDADLDNVSIRKQLTTKWVFSLGILLFFVFLGLIVTHYLIKRNIRKIHHELNVSKQYLNDLLREETAKVQMLESERQDDKRQIAQIESKLMQTQNKYQILENQKIDIQNQAAAIVRMRQSVLRDLYYEIKIKANANNKERVNTLVGLIKELNDNKKLLHLNLKAEFWKKLKAFVDIQYNGFASFVDQHYPSLSLAEKRLLLLSCADVSPQIIKLCMNYSSAVTVSNYKRRLMKEKIGLDVKIEEFIQMYLDGSIK